MRFGLFFVLLVAGTMSRAGETDVSFPRPNIESWKLDNGLTVIYLGVHKTPLVTVQVWYHAGSKDEPRDRRGSAHMFEHLMFRGTERVPPEEHARLLDKIGGEVNAFTTEDMTCFHDTVPPQYMDFAMELEAERMQHLLFLETVIDTEREVVKEEIRQRENNPISKALLKFRELAFTRHPYAWDAGGRIEDLDKTTPEDLMKFYKAYYQPNNAALIVVGDVSRKDVDTSARKWFGGIPRAPDPPRPADALTEPRQKAQVSKIMDPAQIGIVIEGYKIPAAKDKDIPALEVLSTILSRGNSSRLHQRIVRRDKVGVFTGAFMDAKEHPSLLLIFGAHLAPEQGQKVRDDLLDEVKKLQLAKVKPDELQKAKNQLAASFIFELQNVSSIANKIGRSWIYTKDPRSWLDDYGKLLRVTAEDVRRVAKRYLTPESLTVVSVPPGGPRKGQKNGGAP